MGGQDTTAAMDRDDGTAWRGLISASEFVARLEAIEADHAALRLRSHVAQVGGLAGLAFGIVALALASKAANHVVTPDASLAAQPGQAARVSAEHFSLIDGNRVERAALFMGPQGQPVLNFYGHDRTMLSLGFSGKPAPGGPGEFPLIQFTDAADRRRMTLIMDEKHIPQIDMYDALGREVVRMASGQSDKSHLTFRHPATASGLTVGLDTKGDGIPFLRLLNADGRPIAAIP